MQHRDDPTQEVRAELRELTKMVADRAGALAELKREVEALTRKVDRQQVEIDNLTRRRYVVAGWCDDCGMSAADCKCHPEGERP